MIGSPIFQWLEGVRADQIQEWCKVRKREGGKGRNHPILTIHLFFFCRETKIRSLFCAFQH